MQSPKHLDGKSHLGMSALHMALHDRYFTTLPGSGRAILPVCDCMHAQILSDKGIDDLLIQCVGAHSPDDLVASEYEYMCPMILFLSVQIWRDRTR